MTVGKIYCAKLIYENYKHVKKAGRKSKTVKYLFYTKIMCLLIKRLRLHEILFGGDMSFISGCENSQMFI